MTNKDQSHTIDPLVDEDIAHLEIMASFLDNRFRIPGTEIRFGLDGIIGLVPYLGDIISFSLSGVLFSVMLKKGASMLVLLRMMGNLVLDALVGAIPLLGDLFDFAFKANLRNVELLKKYYAEEGPKPKVGTSIFILVILFLVFLAALIWAIGYLVVAGWNWLLA